LRAAVAGREGFTPVAVGIDEQGQGGPRYDVALLKLGRVLEVSVDAATGKLSANEERAVREGHEAFAAKLEALLPSSKIDLARAGRAPGGWARRWTSRTTGSSTGSR